MKYICKICNYIFDEDEKNLKFSDLNDDYRCPICNMDKSYYSLYEEKKERVTVELSDSNPSVFQNKNKCVECGMCKMACYNQMDINNDEKEKFDCINCGQCINVCPTGAMSEKLDYLEVRKLMNDEKNKVFIISTSPSVRVALGDLFGLEHGEFVEGKVVSLLRSIGFKYVLDVNFAADLTIMEESSELIDRIQNGGVLPMFTSCCPAWVKYVEKFENNFIPNLSSAKSPIGMQGATVKSYFANKHKINPANIVHVVVAPCTAKKFEIKRHEMKSASKLIDGDFFDTDYVITTKELGLWAEEEKINFANLEDSKYDSLMGESSGAGTIFGASGGVMEAALRTASHLITGEVSKDVLNLESVRGIDEIKETVLKIGDITLNVAVCYGIKNAKELLSDIKKGEKHFDFVEIMACPGGCISGGGQPKTNHADFTSVKKSRIKSLYIENDKKENKVSFDNSEIIKVYEDFYKKPLSSTAKKLLHTKYVSRVNVDD